MRTALIGAIVLALGLTVGYFAGHGGFGKFGTADVRAAQKADLPSAQGTRDVTSKKLVGVWRSVDDPKSIREFKSDGSVVDTYAGSGDAAERRGEWIVFVGQGREPSSVPLKPGVEYIKITMPEEVAFLAVKTLSENKLQLEYVGGNGEISFTRMR